MDLSHLTKKLSNTYKEVVAGALLTGALLAPQVQGQDLDNNHIHGDVTGATPNITFTQSPGYTNNQGDDGEIGTVDDMWFPDETFVADEAYSGDGKNLYGQERDSERPAMGSSPSLSTPLPVEFAGESVYTRDDEAILEWGTLSETNNAGFEITEINKDGESVLLAYVQGAGTTSEPQSYSTTDTDLSNNPGTLEYEITQVDVDGTNEVVARLEAENPYVGEQGVVSYPNPTQGRTTLDMNLGETAQEATVEVYDMLGRRVSQQQYDVNEGQLETTKDFSNLSSGTYFLRVTGDNDKQYNTRITVTK